jgi:hypothetical protein
MDLENLEFPGAHSLLLLIRNCKENGARRPENQENQEIKEKPSKNQENTPRRSINPGREERRRSTWTDGTDWGPENQENQEIKQKTNKNQENDQTDQEIQGQQGEEEEGRREGLLEIQGREEWREQPGRTGGQEIKKIKKSKKTNGKIKKSTPTIKESKKGRQPEDSGEDGR